MFHDGLILLCHVGRKDDMECVWEEGHRHTDITLLHLYPFTTPSSLHHPFLPPPPPHPSPYPTLHPSTTSSVFLSIIGPVLTPISLITNQAGTNATAHMAKLRYTQPTLPITLTLVNP